MRKFWVILTALFVCVSLGLAQTGETAAPQAAAEQAKTPEAKTVPKCEIVGQIAVKTVPAMTVAAVMEKAADYAPEGGYKPGMEGASTAWELMASKGFEKLGAWITAGGKPTGPALAVFYNDPEKEPAQTFTCKLAFPTADPKADAPIVIEQWPEAFVVSCTYKGPYESSADVWTTCDKWVKDNGYEVVGAPMEVYLAGPADKVPPSEYMTEIRMPVMKIEAKPAEGGK